MTASNERGKKMGNSRSLGLCSYGCCRGTRTGSKARTRKILRAREKRAWQKQANA